MIKIKNLIKTYPGKTIHYPNIFAKEGDFILLTGQTGSGKSTFCEILAKFLSFKAGSILINGIDLKKQNIFDYIHYLEQLPENNLIGPSCYEELELWLKYNSPNQTEGSVIDLALSQFSLENHRDTPIWQLSFGLKKLLAFSVLFLIPRKIWLLDEPFAGLDGEGMGAIKSMMKGFIENSGVIITTSHSAEGFDGFEGKIIFEL